MKQRARIRLVVIYAAAALVLLGTVGPFLWLVSSSFQYERQLLNRPPQWLPNPIVLDSYREIFEGAILGEASGVPYQSRIFLRSFANSFFVAGSVAAIAVLVGAYAAYPLARLNFRGRQVLLFGILASRLIPALSLAIPIVLVAKKIGMSDKIVSLVFINLSFILPYVIWLLQSYFKTIPLELEDAGRIDGCSRLQVVHKIILPALAARLDLGRHPRFPAHLGRVPLRAAAFGNAGLLHQHGGRLALRHRCRRQLRQHHHRRRHFGDSADRLRSHLPALHHQRAAEWLAQRLSAGRVPLPAGGSTSVAGNVLQLPDLSSSVTLRFGRGSRDLKARHFAAALATLLLVAAITSAQGYSIRANRGLNLRAAPSLNAEVAATVRSGVILEVADHVGKWLKINRGAKEVWLADWVNYSRLDDTPAQTETSSQIDNCCFVDRRCHSDQAWTDGYWAFQNGQCPAPAQTSPTTSPQPASGGSGVDNCCFTGWRCASDQEWRNGYLAFQNGQCAGAPKIQPGPADSCCALGWNCAFEFDFIMGKWWFEGNNGQCNQPIQEIVDGVIIEGSRAFIAQHKSAMRLLKTRAPEWHAYTTTIIKKIRQSQPKPGYGTLHRSFNVPVWHSVAYAAAIIVHETCHVQRSFAGVHTHEYENIAEEPICDQVAIEALHKFSPGTAYPRSRINAYYAQGHTWDFSPSVRREWERARQLYAQSR